MHQFALALGVVLMAFLPYPAMARCTAGGVFVWPPAGVSLPANGRIVIEGYGEFQQSVARIAEQKPVLVAKDAVIPLRVLNLYPGQFQVTQAVLEPTEPLAVGKRYQLRLSAPGKPALDFTTSTGKRSVPWGWKITQSDLTPPRWTQAPEAAGGVRKELGCGPSTEAFINLAADDAEHEVRFLVEVSPTDGSKDSFAYLLGATGGKLAVGHGMCSGPFELAPGLSYSARLTAVDLAGNATPAPGPAVSLVGPRS